ncbi:histidine phosphatase family protein [Deinococcus koreensis]|uniref:Histidine phosphatase family protein n=1 Tax=Deinococcus koreensis TaxID=2054903 RepID=A0A2K3V094_9DEIO|nr:histidine phosphatase family protein [Deinococcus koreensis]PNY82209.1 histidine phosphatase family protein [Deinococcus koreensis]
MPRTLHLIKHGRPTIVPGVPAHEWALAEGALDGLPALVARLTPRPDLVVSSEEPKAVATAQGLAAALGVPHRRMVGLHEQLRYTSPFHADPADFEAEIARFFQHPDQVVSGEESAEGARSRFGNAVNAVLAANGQDTIAIVAHGTVISLLAAQANRLDPLPLWRSLGLLGVLTLDVPGLRLRER